jgi:cell division protein FtsN
VEPAEGSGPPVISLPVTPPPPVTPRALNGFLVQAGVFTNLQRAEELHARLIENGIPATLETRVQLGPFRTQAEAQAARARLKALGIDALILPPAQTGLRGGSP